MGAYTKFVTFYSYKGGVGRTSALVNAAILRAIAGNKVVLVDFDLEAPGVAEYLRQLNPKYNQNQEGILEYLYAALTEPVVPGLKERASNLTPYIDHSNGGTLWSINAGNTQDSKYMHRLESLKWREIFANYHGELLIHNLKKQIIKEFDSPDYVFIDSRTGITETGGVCTRYLADFLVILTSLNEQNINGTAMVFKEFVAEKKETLLVASNIPVGMPSMPGQLFSQRVESFKKAFDRSPDLFIYYHAALSLTEFLPAASAGAGLLNSSLHATDPLFLSYYDLANRIEQRIEADSSFLKIVQAGASEFRFLGLGGPATEAQHSYIDILKERFANRKLAKFLIELDRFVKASLQRENSPDDWDRSLFLNIIRDIKSINNEHVHEAYDFACHLIGMIIQEKVSTQGIMKPEWEIYVTDDQIYFLCFAEMAAHRYAWPMDYFARAVKMDLESPYDNAANVFNLMHCYWETENRTEARALLMRFESIFPHINLNRLSTDARANLYFCVAIVKERLGNIPAALDYLNQARLCARFKTSSLFSPISYRQVRPQSFRKQISDAYKRLTNVARSSSNKTKRKLKA